MKSKRAMLLTITLVLLLCGTCGMWLHVQKQQYARNRQLIEALAHGDTKTALALVNAGADPNTRYSLPPTPTLRLLLDTLLRHAPPPDNNSPTAFIIACGTIALPRLHERNILLTAEEDLPLLRTMLAHGANVHARVFSGRTAMHTAVLKARLHTMELLLQHGADVNERDRYGQTPLIVAVRDSNADLARLLLAQGADPNVQSVNGNTALFSAVRIPASRSMISELLAHHADPTLPARNGVTPLVAATQLNLSSDLARLLTQGGK